jgi:hypothetical protein
LQQRELFDGLSLLQQVPCVHVEAVRTVDDLRDAQVHEVDENARKSALRHVAIDRAECLDACGCEFVAVQALAHCVLSAGKVLRDACCKQRVLFM